MTPDHPGPFEPDLTELPSRAAQVMTKTEAVSFGDRRHLITTLGIGGCVALGSVGAILTLHIAAGLAFVAVAELMLAFAAATLIAVCSLSQTGARGKMRRNRRLRCQRSKPHPLG
jgi:hypothetical protein